MTAKEQLRRVVEDLPESDARATLEFIASRREDPLLRALAEAPEDDEPFTVQDEAALKEARDEIAAGARMISFEEIKRELEHE